MVVVICGVVVVRCGVVVVICEIVVVICGVVVVICGVVVVTCGVVVVICGVVVGEAVVVSVVVVDMGSSAPVEGSTSQMLLYDSPQPLSRHFQSELLLMQSSPTLLLGSPSCQFSNEKRLPESQTNTPSTTKSCPPIQ